MRVLHFSQSYYGGIATYLNELLPFQSAAYGEVTVLGPARQSGLIAPIDRLNVVSFPDAGRHPAGLLALYRHLRHHLRQHRYDVVHLHSSFAGAVGRLGRRFPGTRIVYCPHGWAQGMAIPAARRRLYAGIERLLAARTDAVINISASEARHATTAGIPEARCHLVYNGLRDAPFRPLPADHRLRRLLFVGRYDRQKGVDLLAAALPALHERGYAVTTIGGPIIGKPVITQLPSYVTDLGWQSPEAVCAAIDAADAIIMPSRWEGFSLVALEAMRAARPILASAVSSLPEAVVDGVTGILMPPESPSAIVDGIDRLAALDARQLGLQGRSRFEAKFTADRMFSQLDAVYRRIVEVAP